MKRREARFKVTVIGAGNVGSTLAMRVWESGLADVVLLDICASMAQGKALDIWDESGMSGVPNTITGTGDYSAIKGSDVVVITAGFPRKPGMSREELVAKNAAVIKEVTLNIRANAPETIIIVVTNPLDAMTYLAYKTSSFERTRVMGMAGLLDESRFITLISNELKVHPKDVKTVMMGSHGDTMVPIISQTKVGNKNLKLLLPKDKIDELIRITRDRGARIVGLLGSGSAYYSPSFGAFKMVEAILKDKGGSFTASAYLEGEYGLSGICIGVPVRLGAKGIESISRIKLAGDEEALLIESSKAIGQTIKHLS